MLFKLAVRLRSRLRKPLLKRLHPVRNYIPQNNSSTRAAANVRPSRLDRLFMASCINATRKKATMLDITHTQPIRVSNKSNKTRLSINLVYLLLLGLILVFLASSGYAEERNEEDENFEEENQRKIFLLLQLLTCFTRGAFNDAVYYLSLLAYEFPETKLEKAILLMEHGQFKEAETEFNKIFIDEINKDEQIFINKLTQKSAYLFVKGVILLSIEAYHLAIPCLDAALELNPPAALKKQLYLHLHFALTKTKETEKLNALKATNLRFPITNHNYPYENLRKIIKNNYYAAPLDQSLEKKLILRVWTPGKYDEVGHVSLETNQHHISFWPNKEKFHENKLKLLQPFSKQGRNLHTYLEDIISERRLPDYKVIFYNLDSDAINLAFEKFQASNLDWSLWGSIIPWHNQNCAGLSRHLLRLGGMSFNDQRGWLDLVFRSHAPAGIIRQTILFIVAGAGIVWYITAPIFYLIDCIHYSFILIRNPILDIVQYLFDSKETAAAHKKERDEDKKLIKSNLIAPFSNYANKYYDSILIAPSFFPKLIDETWWINELMKQLHSNSLVITALANEEHELNTKLTALNTRITQMEIGLQKNRANFYGNANIKISASAASCASHNQLLEELATEAAHIFNAMHDLLDRRQQLSNFYIDTSSRYRELLWKNIPFDSVYFSRPMYHTYNAIILINLATDPFWSTYQTKTEKAKQDLIVLKNKYESRFSAVKHSVIQLSHENDDVQNTEIPGITL